MKNIAAVLVLATQVLATIALAQSNFGVELQGAITKEQVDGDLKTAIAIYQKIAADASAPREVRAKALLHLAGCYEKLGKQAQNVYQQIVRDFGDQPEAAKARVRLTALRQDDRPAAPATITQRKIDAPGLRPGPGDTDGHRAVYLNKPTGEVIYGDLAGKSKRVIFKMKPGWENPGFYPSKDFSMLLLEQDEKFAVITIDGTGYHEIARLSSQGLCSYWSWDSRYVVLCDQPQPGMTRMRTVAVADGKVRELARLKTVSLGPVAFSPDGRFIAYQIWPSKTDPVSRIFILPADGGDPQAIYSEELSSSLRMLDWTPDGRYLAVGSGRTGKAALYLLPLNDGKAAGAPVFVKYGDFENGSTTAAGALIYRAVRPGGVWSVYVASLDAEGRPANWQRLDLPLGNRWNPEPKWSPDSRRIVYTAENSDMGQVGGEVIHLHDLSTGEDRQIYHALDRTYCVWAVQQPKLFCVNWPGQREHTDFFSIAVDSGEIAQLGSVPWRAGIEKPSRDDRALFLYNFVRDLSLFGEERWMYDGYWRESDRFVRWEIATRQETVLESGTGTSLADNRDVSPDGRWIVQDNAQGLQIRPASGGYWKSLVSASKTETIGQPQITPDGRWVTYRHIDPAGRQSLFRLSIDGGKPERLGDYATNMRPGGFAISPDRSKVMVASGDFDNQYEIWSLENFEPVTPKGTK